ncbi:MAG: hypothetical protein KKB37_17240 [Alphaproteobacteria bacterium]|nr:hypothetical protein [Alphaproteobacteria bacterium]
MPEIKCACISPKSPEDLDPNEIKEEIAELLYDKKKRKECGATDRELLSIVVRADKAGHFDFLQAVTEWKVIGKWKPDGAVMIEPNVSMDVEFMDVPKAECIGERLIELLKAYNKKVVREDVLYARTIPVEEGTLPSE